MANVRQMPKLYVRGSLANVTMAGLTKDQRKHVDKLVEKVSTHPDMQRHKIKVMKELGVTIAADYSDDRLAAEEEYNIAIWRGVVDIFYHHKYTFTCRACNSGTYTTKRSKPKAIDRVQIPCPNCRKVEIDNPGEVDALKEKVRLGEVFIDHDEFQASYKDMPEGFGTPTCKSTILPIAGARKYTDPQSIIDDDKQLRKFFGEFVWNYFRQQINENKRTEHRKDPVPLTGETDWLIVQEIISLCNLMGVDYNYCEKVEPQHGVYSIRLCGVTTPPEFTVEFARLRAKGELYGVQVTAGQSSIDVAVSPDAAPMPMNIEIDKKTKEEIYRWQVKVYKPEHVSVLDNFSNAENDQENSGFTISQVSYRTVRGGRMDLDDHVESVDNREAMSAIRDALPEGHCQDVFDIFAGQSEIYDRFSAKYGDKEPRINHVAEFLGITTRAVNNHKESIRIHMDLNNLVPS